MRNIIRRTIGALVSLANKAIAGMTLYVPQLTLPNSVAANLSGKLEALTLADTNHKESVVALKERRLEFVAATLAAVQFARIVRELLRPRLGKRYTQAWDAVGFSGSLTIRTAEADLLRVLYSMAAYLTSHPIANAGDDITTVRAMELHDALAAAGAALVQQSDAVGQAMANRDAKAAALESALRVLLSELHKKLTPLDSRWLAFGFQKPGALAIPAVPENLAATLVGATVVSVKWDSAARAQYYRIWKKVIGVDADYVATGTATDLNFTMEGLPANSQIEVVLSALNSGGESAWTPAITVQTS